MKCKSRLLCSLFVVLFCLSGSAWAVGLGGPAYSVAVLSGDSLVYTTSEAYKTGTLGLIDSDSQKISANLVSNLGGDAVVFSFMKDGESKVFLADRLSSGAKTEARIYTPGKWTSPDWNATLTGNVHGVTATSKDLYISYYGDKSGLGWVEKRSLSDYSVSISKDIVPVSSEDKVESMLSSVDGKVFLMVQGFKKYSTSYDKGAVYELNSDLTVAKSVDLGINPVSFSSWSDKLYVACNGGYNALNDGAYSIAMAGLLKESMEFSGFESSSEYLSGVYCNDSKIFVITSLMDPTTYATENKIYMIDSLKSKAVRGRPAPYTLGDPVAKLSGYLAGAVLDEDGDLFVCAGDGETGSLLGISDDGSEKVEYTSAESSSSSSSGGCSVGFAPSVLLLLAPILFFSKNR